MIRKTWLSVSIIVQPTVTAAQSQLLCGRLGYWKLVFPFQYNLGWEIACSVLNFGMHAKKHHSSHPFSGTYWKGPIYGKHTKIPYPALLQSLQRSLMVVHKPSLCIRDFAQPFQVLSAVLLRWAHSNQTSSHFSMMLWRPERAIGSQSRGKMVEADGFSAACL
jgi:hypothetical protein